MTSLASSGTNDNGNGILYFYLPHSTKSDNSTRKVIEKTLKGKFNFQLVENIKDMNGDATILIWSSTFMSGKFLAALPYKILLNHFPRSVEVGHKVNLYRNLNLIKESDFLPLSFLSLHDWHAWYVQQVDKSDKSNDNHVPKYWITKPIKGGGGRRVEVWSSETLLTKCANVKDNFAEGGTDAISARNVVQKYITNPLLYGYNNAKFDIRAYVLVMENGEIYLYEEGLLRMASKTYDLDEKNIKDPYIHLTNNSVNKRNNIRHGACENLLWSEYFIGDLKDKWNSDIMPQLKNITKITFTHCLLKNKKIQNEINKYKMKVSSFELFGIDCIIDETFKVWLLEINHMPEIETSNSARADKLMNYQLVLDMFNLIFQRKEVLNDGIEVLNKFVNTAS